MMMMTITLNGEKHEVMMKDVEYDYFLSIKALLKNNKDVDIIDTDSCHGFSDNYLLFKDNCLCVLDFQQKGKLCRIWNGELISILYEDVKKEYRNCLKKIFRVSTDIDFIRRLLDYYSLHYIDVSELMDTSKISFVEIY
jgi:hypothetical protein